MAAATLLDRSRLRPEQREQVGMLKDAGEVWTVEDLAAYVTDPNKFVQEKTGDTSARTKMTFKLNKNQADIAAYLASASPATQ